MNILVTYVKLKNKMFNVHLDKIETTGGYATIGIYFELTHGIGNRSSETPCRSGTVPSESSYDLCIFMFEFIKAH